MNFVRKTIGFNDHWLMIFGTPIIAFFINVIMFPQLFSEDTKAFFFHCFTIGLTYTLTYWVIFRQVLAYMVMKFPDSEDVVKRIFLQLILMVLGYFLIKVVVGNILLLCMNDVMAEWKNEVEKGKLSEMIGSFMSIFLIWAIYEGMIFYTKLQKSVRETEQLQRENIQSQLEGLKNQVNPHFLFNSLNTLIYLIPEDPNKAISFVQKLSKVYRYILEIRDKKIISIGEELEFLNAYVFLLKERFGENININIKIPDEFNRRKIVPLSMQILFENAIKHNIISTHKPLAIEVFIEKEKLIVKNNLQKKNHVSSSTRVGLQNIKNRYQFFTDQEVDVIVTSNSFLVALPLVEHIREESEILEKVKII